MERAEYQGDGEDICMREHLAVAPYFTLARGFLTGKYRPDEELPATPRAGGISQAYLNDRGWSVLEVLDEVAAAHDATLAQVSLAWRAPSPVPPRPSRCTTSWARWALNSPTTSSHASTRWAGEHRARRTG